LYLHNKLCEQIGNITRLGKGTTKGFKTQHLFGWTVRDKRGKVLIADGIVFSADSSNSSIPQVLTKDWKE